jgi:hypothetical protein
MPAWGWVIVAVAVVLVVLAAVVMVFSKRRTATLRGRFGPEYDRTLARTSHKRDAEAELKARQARRNQLVIRDLTGAARRQYQQDWRGVQSQFVDDPVGAIRGADILIQSVMRDRGYPVKDFDQRADDLSVDHPEVVQNYWQAHGLVTGRRKASTEDLRQAMWHYRALFEELIEPAEGDRAPAAETGRSSRQEDGTSARMPRDDEVSRSSISSSRPDGFEA